VLSCRAPKRLAVLAPTLPRALVIDSQAGKVWSAPKEAFELSASRGGATSESDLPLTPVCDCRAVDGSSLILHVDGQTVLLSPHQSPEGELSEERLFETVPVWRSMKDAYEPPAEAVSRLAAVDRPTDLTVVMATWCGDSKAYVPRLLKALERATNPNLRLRLIGLGPDFQSPMETIQSLRITNVPTVIVRRDGQELGRFVETPAGVGIEADLLSILEGREIEHRGRHERGSLVATGRYVWRDVKGRDTGRESFEVYYGKDGGRVVHARRDDGTEIWHSVDAAGRPTFLEVTERSGENLHRVRHWVRGGTLSSQARGSETGLIDQTLAVPADICLCTPAAADELLTDATTAYVTHEAPGAVMGVLRASETRSLGPEEVATPAGTFVAERLLRSVDGTLTEWWRHPELPVPVRGRLNDGSEVLLAELTTALGPAPGVR
jgi:hypothetical protein